MATPQEMKAYLLADFKKHSPKADAQECKRVQGLIQAKSKEELLRTYNNTLWMNSKASDRYVEREVRKMDKAGMFNISKLGAKNALD